MCVYGKGWFSGAKEKDDVGGFWPYSRDAQKPFTCFFEGQGVNEIEGTVVFFEDYAREVLYDFRFVPV